MESMAAMDSPAITSWEVLIVDNNSSDNTPLVAEKFAGHLPIRYFFEEKQGLSYARNRALKECKGELLVFTDDDMLMPKGWLNAYKTAAASYPGAGYFGGRILPHWPHGRPGWIKDESMPMIGGLLGFYDLGETTRPYAEGEMHPFGANFALRRILFQRLAPFRTDLGVSGTIPGRGEEADYFCRAREHGAAGVYVGEALCLHRVQSEHLGLRFLYRFGIQKGIEIARLSGAVQTLSITGELYLFLKSIFQLLKGRGDLFRQCVIALGMVRGKRSVKKSCSRETLT